MINELVNNPDASRLIHGLRDTGYNFNTAAADIIDNSIAAGADHIDVRIDIKTDGRKIVTFADNGHGMTAEELFSAMRYGAPVRENKASLGKFGLGLKTASSSVCLHYTVLSRKNAKQKLTKLAWDLDHVSTVDKWEMLKEPVTAEEKEQFENLCGDHGTLVVWKKCDRLLNTEYQIPGGHHEMRAIRKIAQKLSDHCSMIYYRFLDKKDSREKNIKLYIDGSDIAPWNPFYPEKSEQALSVKNQELPLETEKGEVYTAGIKAYILPRRNELSKQEQDLAKIANHRQGFYIHREGRVIHSGGWLGVFGANEPHTSLLRVEFDFTHELDEAFSVDVKKSRILFDPALVEALKTILVPIYRQAGNTYRNKKKQDIVKGGIDHTPSNTNIANTDNKKEPSSYTPDPDSGATIVSNSRGKVKLIGKSQDNVDASNVHVNSVDYLASGNLYEPAMRQAKDGDGYQTGVNINKSHDFYAKIYARAKSNGYSVEGMDYLLWALSASELDNVNTELEQIFDDFRKEVSTNLDRLLRALPLPDIDEFDE